MQIKEIISLYINDSSGIMDVIFRIYGDDENFVRIDEIELEESKIFGYNFTENIIQNLTEDEEDNVDIFFDTEEDSDDNINKTISFLEEYYLLYPERVPSVSEY